MLNKMKFLNQNQVKGLKLGIGALLFLVFQAYAQPNVTSNQDRFYIQKGNLINLKIVPQEKHLEIHVVGTKGAEIDIDKLGLRATLHAGKQSRVLKLKKSGNYYLLDRTEIGADGKNQIKLDADVDGRSESFDLKLK